MPLIFGGPGKMPSELEQAIEENNIDAIHVESLTELQRIATLTETLDRSATIFLRMNIDIGDITLSKLAMGGNLLFGLDESELNNALTLLRDFPKVHLKGFHFHLMSHQLDVDRHLALMQRYFQVVKKDWQTRFQLDEAHDQSRWRHGYQLPKQ